MFLPLEKFTYIHTHINACSCCQLAAILHCHNSKEACLGQSIKPQSRRWNKFVVVHWQVQDREGEQMSARTTRWQNVTQCNFQMRQAWCTTTQWTAIKNMHVGNECNLFSSFTNQLGKKKFTRKWLNLNSIMGFALCYFFQLSQYVVHLLGRLPTHAVQWAASAAQVFYQVATYPTVLSRRGSFMSQTVCTCRTYRTNQSRGSKSLVSFLFLIWTEIKANKSSVCDLRRVLKSQRLSIPRRRRGLLPNPRLYRRDHNYLWDAHLLTGVQEVLHITSAFSHAELRLGEKQFMLESKNRKCASKLRLLSFCCFFLAP